MSNIEYIIQSIKAFKYDIPFSKPNAKYLNPCGICYKSVNCYQKVYLYFSADECSPCAKSCSNFCIGISVEATVVNALLILVAFSKQPILP